MASSPDSNPKAPFRQPGQSEVPALQQVSHEAQLVNWMKEHGKEFLKALSELRTRVSRLLEGREEDTKGQRSRGVRMVDEEGIKRIISVCENETGDIRVRKSREDGTEQDDEGEFDQVFMNPLHRYGKITLDRILEALTIVKEVKAALKAKAAAKSGGNDSPPAAMNKPKPEAVPKPVSRKAVKTPESLPKTPVPKSKAPSADMKGVATGKGVSPKKKV